MLSDMIEKDVCGMSAGGIGFIPMPLLACRSFKICGVSINGW